MKRILIALAIVALGAGSAQASTADEMIKTINEKTTCSSCNQGSAGIVTKVTNSVNQSTTVNNPATIKVVQNQSSSSSSSSSAASASASASANKASAASSSAASAAASSARSSSGSASSSASAAAASSSVSASTKSIVDEKKVAVTKSVTKPVELPKAGAPLAVPALGSLGVGGFSLALLKARAKSKFIALNL